MTNRNNKTIGIVGGMGPLATVDLFSKILTLSNATRDQDYPRIVIDNDSTIPDRTEAIVGGGEDPVPHIVAAGKRMIQAGAHILGIPCNTSHVFFDRIQSELSVPVVHMIRATVGHVTASYPEARKVGVLSTNGTRSARLYEEELSRANREPIVLSHEDQQSLVVEAIYGVRGIKAGYKKRPKELLVAALQVLKNQGAQVVVLGCTEIPLVLQQKDSAVPLVDSTEVLARALLRAAREEPR